LRTKAITGLVVLLALFAVAVTGCGDTGKAGSEGTAGAGYQNVTAEELKFMISSEKNLFIVDVRENEETARGYIAGSLLLPLSEFQSWVDEIPRDKKVVIVCASGSRSPQVAEYLVRLGYPEVYNLSDGLMVWTGELVK
jgi:rhodanese-related sulfurtransferase